MLKYVWLLFPIGLMAVAVNTSETQFQNPPATTTGVSTSQSQYQNPKANDKIPAGTQVSIPVQNNLTPADTQTIINSKRGGVIYQSNPLNDYSQPGTATQNRASVYTGPIAPERSTYSGASSPDNEWHNTPNNQNYYDDPNWPHVKKSTYRR